MADRFVDLKISDVELETTPVQNDQLTEDVQAATSGENMVNDWKSTNTSENVLDQMRTAIENSVSLTDYVVELTVENSHAIGTCMVGQGIVDNSGLNCSNLMDHVIDREKKKIEDIDKVSHGVVDRNKATVEDTIGTLNDDVKTPLDGHPLGSGMVNRRQSTVDSLASNLMDYVIHCEKRKNEKISNGMVDRNKATVEDSIGTTNDHNVNGEQSMSVKDPHISGSLVDRNKATVEHTASNSSDYVVDREKSTVEEPQPCGVVNHNKNIVAASCTPTNCAVVADRQKPRVDNSQPGIAGIVVDREKRTVEDPASTAEGLANGDKWLVQLHVDNASGEEIMKHLPTSPQCIEWNKQVVFGRGGSVDVFINDDHASREHVRLIGQILPNGQVLFMTRNISSRSQGYNVNGENITDKNQWIPLKKKDQLKIAKLVFIVDIIPGRVSMQNFVLEFKLPQISNTVLSSPTTSYPTAPYLPAPYPTTPYPTSPHSVIGEQGFYNQYPMPPGFQYYGHFASPTQATAPGYYVPHPVHTPWPSALDGIPPDQQYLRGYSSYISNDMVERLLLQYQGREGYVTITDLRHLAVEAVGEWRELGRALGLEDYQLTMIDIDHHQKVGERSYQMLKTWVCMKPENATRVNLKTALEDITVGRGDLAVKYCNTSLSECQRVGETN